MDMCLSDDNINIFYKSTMKLTLSGSLDFKCGAKFSSLSSSTSWIDSSYKCNQEYRSHFDKLALSEWCSKDWESTLTETSTAFVVLPCLPGFNC